MRAIWSENLNLVKFLLDCGADIHAVDDEQGFTALACAAERNNEEITQLLIDYGAEINHQDFHGQTALHSAILHNSLNNFICLLKNGADHLIKSKSGYDAEKFADLWDRNEFTEVLSSYSKTDTT